MGLSKLSFETQREGQTRWTQKSISRLITEWTHMLPLWELTRSRRTPVSACDVLWKQSSLTCHTRGTRQAQIRLFSSDQTWIMPHRNCFIEIWNKKRRKDNQWGHLRVNKSRLKSSEHMKSAPEAQHNLLKLRLSRRSLTVTPTACETFS